MPTTPAPGPDGPTEPTGAPAAGPHDPERRNALYRSLVDDAFGFCVAIRSDFTVGFVSRSVVEHTARNADDLVGRSVAEFVHPDDLDRALLLTTGWQVFGAPKGAAGFRLQHADGTWLPFDVTAAQVDDGVDEYLAVYCTPVDYQHATDRVLSSLLHGADRAGALRPVLDVFSWQLNGASVAISWFEPEGGHRFVSTGLPAELCGASDRPLEPWATARATQEPVLQLEGAVEDRDVRELAAEHHRGGVWVVPVPDVGSTLPALVTVWSGAGGPRPDGHSYGMSIAQTYIDLILRWSNQVSALNQAAHHDPLTNLPNRTRLFEALDDGATKGALMFCDLDQFKPVNDALGHAAGDEVLRQIAARIQRAVRVGDLVARTGGDEFVVLAPGVNLEQAAALAQRIRTAVAEPTELDDGTVQVGVTIGVAHSDDGLTELHLAGADQALMSAKAAARGTVRWAPGPMPVDSIAIQLPFTS